MKQCICTAMLIAFILLWLTQLKGLENLLTLCANGKIVCSLSSSKTHTIYTPQQHQFDPKSQIRQLQQLSDTQWACRYFAVDVMHSTYSAILVTLQIIIKCQDRTRVVKAEGILLQVKSFKFLVTLVLF